MQDLSMHVPYVKIYFQLLQWSVFFVIIYFQQLQWKVFFVHGPNNSDSVLENAAIGEIEDHSLRTTPFQNKIVTEGLSLCLPYVKRYLEEHQSSEFFFMAQITQILLFLGISILERRKKITVWKRHLSNKKNCHVSFEFASKHIYIDSTLKQRWSSTFINVVSTLIFGWKRKLSRRTFIDVVSTLAKQLWNNVDRITSIQRQ